MLRSTNAQRGGHRARRWRVPRLGAAGLALGLALTPPTAVEARSALRLPAPGFFGEIAANTYDEDGRMVGPAWMKLTQLPGGRVRLSVRSGFEKAPYTAATALLAPTGDDGALRVVSEESRSVNERGEPLGVLSIDHEGRTARCTKAHRDGDGVREYRLPSLDRVANVPLSLLFQVLVAGDQERVDFQVFVCLGGPRLLPARAVLAAPEATRGRTGAHPLYEVRYSLSLGPLLGTLARPFVPRMSVWLDPSTPSAWIGSRMPLYGRGPTVLVVRSGVEPESLTRTP